MRITVLASLVAVAACTGCGPSASVKAALYGDLSTLQREIARAERAGELDRDEVVSLAEAVVAREIASASGPSGVQRVRSVRACAKPVLSGLRSRAERRDAIGAEATLVLLSQRDVSPGELVRRHRTERDGAWRAVAARAALEPAARLLRRSFFVDPDQRVRRAALEAALIAPEPADLPELLEVFRLDPDPLSRSLAARAAGAVGGEAAVLGLMDRFPRADEADRLAVVDALAMPAAWNAGGARVLRNIAESKHGMVSVAAVNALLRFTPDDGSLVGLSLMTLEHGTDQERRVAIPSLPLSDPRVPDALRKAAQGTDDISVLALARLLELPADRAGAQKRLRELAAKNDDVAADARAVLAAAGDRSVIAALARDVQHGPPMRRQSAALSLFRLGEPAKAARALGDADPDVRLAVSCGVVSQAHARDRRASR